MSVTFTSDGQRTTRQLIAPCLCAQRAECFGEAFGEAQEGRPVHQWAAELSDAADPHCSTCDGTGIEVGEVDDLPEVNFANGNVLVILVALGLPQDWVGSCPLPVARRGAWAFLNRRRLEPQVQRALDQRNGWELEARGTYGVRVVTQEMTEDGLRERVQSFATFVEQSSMRGATVIRWG